jgi:hypothetical protein
VYAYQRAAYSHLHYLRLPSPPLWLQQESPRRKKVGHLIKEERGLVVVKKKKKCFPTGDSDTRACASFSLALRDAGRKRRSVESNVLYLSFSSHRPSPFLLPSFSSTVSPHNKTRSNEINKATTKSREEKKTEGRVAALLRYISFCDSL